MCHFTIPKCVYWDVHLDILNTFLLFKEKEMRRQQAVLLKHQVSVHLFEQTVRMPIINQYLSCMGDKNL